jgi:hypothetical protein
LHEFERNEGLLPHYATLAIVAMEKKIPFPGRNFNDEYWVSYARESVARSKTANVPLRQASEAVADELVAVYLSQARSR